MFDKLKAAAGVATIGATVLAGASAAYAAEITGAGSTFGAPIYNKWAETYKKQTGTGLNYQAIGSGGGIKQIKAKTVDFGASDKPLKPSELDEAGLTQFPTVVGGVVPVVNLPGIAPGQLKMDGPLVASIFLGDIKKWNDPKIEALNPGVKLPGLPITVVHRSDGSGTTFLFTSYLSMTSPGWSGRVGASEAVSWPTGLGGKGSDGVAGFVKQTVGSIGYVEFTFIQQNKMTYVDMKDRAGQYLAPTAQAFSAAASHGDWNKAPDFYLLLLNEPGVNSWPITGATFILVQKNQADAAKGREVLKFFDWAYKNGDGMASQLAYVPLPASVKGLIRQSWQKNIKAGGQPVFRGQ